MNFKYIHPTALIGFFLNVFCAVAVQGEMRGLSSPVTTEEIEFYNFISIFMKAYWASLVFQAVALALISMRVRWALYLAAAAAILSLPAGFIYLVGCAFSQNAWTFEAFEEGTYDARALGVYPFAVTRNIFTIGLVLLIFGGILLFIFNNLSGGFFVGTGCFMAYLGSRVKDRFVLTLHDEFFTYVANHFAKVIRVPYSSVISGQLIDENSVKLEIKTKDGPASLIVNVKSILQDDRREALDALGRMLAYNNVPLH